MRNVVQGILTLLIALKIQMFNSTLGSNIHILETALGTKDILGENTFFEIIEPEELSYTYKIRPAKDFGSSFNTTYLGKNLRMIPADPPWSCTKPKNADLLRGHVALIERGECSFVQKATIGESIGAKAIIISDNVPDNDDYYIEMVSDNSRRSINIPVAFLVGKNGRIIRNTLRRLDMSHAIINIPVNLTYVPLHKIKQPPWMGI